ncbi:hypothetical protein PL81_33725 [Streptomyces sp. RSD-27]|nr:hypothetical protein PL81_33725 [Streptomyces sp. RSD-27]
MRGMCPAGGTARPGTPGRRRKDGRAMGSLGQEIAALWGAHLGGREVGVEDDFFAIGGNSLSGIKIIEQVSEQYGVQLSVRDFYLAQTPARVAELVERARTGA